MNAFSYLYLEDDQFDRCVDSASGALDKGGLRKEQSVHIVKGMCQYNLDKLTAARDSLCNVAELLDEQTTNRISAHAVSGSPLLTVRRAFEAVAAAG